MAFILSLRVQGSSFNPPPLRGSQSNQDKKASFSNSGYIGGITISDNDQLQPIKIGFQIHQFDQSHTVTSQYDNPSNLCREAEAGECTNRFIWDSQSIQTLKATLDTVAEYFKNFLKIKKPTTKFLEQEFVYTDAETPLVTFFPQGDINDITFVVFEDLNNDWSMVNYRAIRGQGETGRPVLGILPISPDLFSTNSQLPPQDFIVHDILHALGFEPKSFPLWEGDFYTGEDESESQPIQSLSPETLPHVVQKIYLGHKYSLLRTKNAVDTFIKYYGGNPLLPNAEKIPNGIELVDLYYLSGRIFGNEIMSNIIESDALLTPFSVAILLDTGWYEEINDNKIIQQPRFGMLESGTAPTGFAILPTYFAYHLPGLDYYWDVDTLVPSPLFTQKYSKLLTSAYMPTSQVPDFAKIYNSQTEAFEVHSQFQDNGVWYAYVGRYGMDGAFFPNTCGTCFSQPASDLYNTLEDPKTADFEEIGENSFPIVTILSTLSSDSHRYSVPRAACVKFVLDGENSLYMKLKDHPAVYNCSTYRHGYVSLQGIATDAGPAYVRCPHNPKQVIDMIKHLNSQNPDEPPYMITEEELNNVYSAIDPLEWEKVVETHTPNSAGEWLAYYAENNTGAFVAVVLVIIVVIAGFVVLGLWLGHCFCWKVDIDENAERSDWSDVWNLRYHS